MRKTLHGVLFKQAERIHPIEYYETVRASSQFVLGYIRVEDIIPPSMTTDGARSILQCVSVAAELDVAYPKHDYHAPHGGRRGTGEVLVRTFGHTVASWNLHNSGEMVRERYSHIQAGEPGDLVTEALDEFGSDQY